MFDFTGLFVFWLVSFTLWPNQAKGLKIVQVLSLKNYFQSQNCAGSEFLAKNFFLRLAGFGQGANSKRVGMVGRYFQADS